MYINYVVCSCYTDSLHFEWNLHSLEKNYFNKWHALYTDRWENPKTHNQKRCNTSTFQQVNAPQIHLESLSVAQHTVNSA